MRYARQAFWSMGLTIVVLCAWFVPLETTANTQVDAGLRRALVSFASARALNAVISVVEGTQLAIEPAGIGVKLSVGQVLRPVNDIVEQFAHLMLAASIAFGVEKFLIAIGAHWLVSLVVTAVAGSWALLVLFRSSSPAWLTKLLVVLLMVRFAMPLAIIGSDRLFHQFMANDYASSQKTIELATGQLSAMSDASPQVGEQKGAWDRFKDWTSKYADIRPQIANLKLAAEQTMEHIVKLMVIFLLQTLVLPLLLVWILWAVAKGTFELPIRAA